MILGAIIRARVSESRTVSENEEIVRGCVCVHAYMRSVRWWIGRGGGRFFSELFSDDEFLVFVQVTVGVQSSAAVR